MTELRRTSVHAVFDRPVDVAWLAFFRVLFGLTMAWSVVRFIAYGWIDSFFVEPKLHFKYFGFEWVEPLSPLFMHALFYVLACLALLVALGCFFRIAAIAFAIGFSYLQLVDAATYLNHYYLACLLAFLIAASPAHRAASVDVLLGRVAPLREIPALWLYLFRFQVGVVYTFAGLAKTNADWLLNAQPLSIWLASKTGMPVLGPLFAEHWAATLFSWGGFLFDTTIVWFLLYRRTRPFAYLAVITFHAITRVLFPIGMFPVIMVLSALVFFPPSWPRKILSRFAPALREHTSQTLSRVPKWLLASAVIYCAVQILLPIRFLAYGGNVLWHEQGMRFSWRVMVREKNGAITYVVTSKNTGRVWHVSPCDYLTRIQERELSAQPDLMLQLAHHIRDDFESRGLGVVSVRVDALVSLNGRPARPLIDPSIDLAALHDGFDRAHWITQAPEDSPPTLRPIARVASE